MKKHYDLSKMKSRPNPYVAVLLEQERASILEGIARGEIALSEGRTRTQLQVEQKLARLLK